MQKNIKTAFSTIFILIVLCTSTFAQDKALPLTKSTKSEQTQNIKFRAEYLPANIEKAQQLLKNKGFYKGDITGLIDSSTKNAIKTYQQDVGLNPTGHLNKDTRQKLGIEEVQSLEKPIKNSKVKEFSTQTK